MLQYKDGSHEPDATIWQSLNKQVNNLISNVEKCKRLLDEDLVMQSKKLLDALSNVYIEAGHRKPFYPLITAFSHWCECYPNSKISTLLDDSDLYGDNKKSQIAENNKQHEDFFEYLNCKKKVGEEKIKWCNAEQALRDDETNNIVNQLFN